MCDARRNAYTGRMKLIALLALVASPAAAFTQDDVLQASLLPGWTTDQGTRMAAVELVLAPGWKTYWRSPGDAGIPPQFDWSGSVNLGAVTFHWPAPVVFDTNGMRSIGYHDVLVLPVEVTPRDPTQPVALQGRIDLGVCKDICVPAMVNVAVDLPVAGVPNPTIKRALRDLPLGGDQAGLADIRCTVAPIADGLRVTAVMQLPPQGGAEAVVIEPGLAGVWVSEAVATRDGGTLTATADMIAGSGAPFALNRSAIVLTIIGDDHAVETTGCPGG